MTDQIALATAPRVILVDGCDEPCVGRTEVLRGQARAGHGTLRYVELSLDAGATWEEATLTGPNVEGLWVEWEHPWLPAHQGVQTLRMRVTDSAGVRRDAITATFDVRS